MATSGTPILIKACLNGRRPAGSHPALPVSAEEVARAAVAVRAAGAGAVHVHPRAFDGSESQSAEDVGRTVMAVRAASPGLPVGVTTGFWIAGDAASRSRQVEAWRDLPDFTSVNWSEEGSPELAELLIAMGVGVEMGLGSVEHARAFAASSVAPRCLRVLVEVRERDRVDAVTRAAQIDEVLDAAGLTVPRLHHGFGADTWGVLEVAFDKGRDARIGLEDTFTLPDGAEAKDNAALVAAAVARARRHGREPVGA